MAIFTSTTEDHWWFHISPEGSVTLGTLVNFVITVVSSKLGTPPLAEICELVDRVRIPRAALGHAPGCAETSR